jgi:hypothetical protein
MLRASFAPLSLPLPSSAKSVRQPQERRPLLVIDGDSFAHRAYHALPKSIRRKDDKPAGAILGFANFLLRRYREEQPRAVLVGWDTYEAPTYRHEAFPAYQSGRAFDDDVIEQLAVMRGAHRAAGGARRIGDPGQSGSGGRGGRQAIAWEPGAAGGLLMVCAVTRNTSYRNPAVFARESKAPPRLAEKTRRAGEDSAPRRQ